MSSATSGISVGERARRWAERSDLSARSVLVTMLGDSIAPLGGEVWLADLFELAEPFGFSQRLIRTSLSRLAAEGWVESRREGRLSRYRLTDFADDEFRQADRRIYRRPGPAHWSRHWLMVLTGIEHLGGDGRDRLTEHLRWRGLAEVGRGVWITPSPHDSETASLREIEDEFSRLFRRLALTIDPPIALATFANLESMVEAGLFSSWFSLEEVAELYQRLFDEYDWTRGVDLTDLAPDEALTIRTMVVHDLRRARLADPDLPLAALPTDWIGVEAMDLAAAVHRQVDASAWLEVERVTGLGRGRADGRLEARFSPLESP